MILFHQRGKAQKSFNKTKEISTYTLPNDNGTLAITGNIGSTAIIALVEKPSILYPSNGSSEYNNSITISQYVIIIYILVQKHIQLYKYQLIVILII